MSYIKPSTLVYQELANAGGATNSTPDLADVIVGPLYNVVRVDPTSDTSLTNTLGASSTNVKASSAPIIAGGPDGLKINLTSTKPGQIMDNSSVAVYATNAYVNTISFTADIGDTATTAFDGTSFRSTFALWNQTSQSYNVSFTPSGATPEKALPDGSGSFVKIGDKALVTFTSPDAVGGVTTYSCATGTKVVTVTCSVAHGLVAGSKVRLTFAASPPDLSADNGIFTIVSATANSFVVNLASNYSGTSIVGATVTVDPVITISSFVTKVVTGVDQATNAVTNSITISQQIPTFTSTGSVTATIQISRFYASTVIPMTYVSGINTIQQFDLTEAPSGYIYLLTDTGPSAYSTVTYGTPDQYNIVSGNFHVGYKAIRQDLYSTVVEISSDADREAQLGEATELNPLSLGVQLSLANTTTTVLAVSLKYNSVTGFDWTNALDLLENHRGAYALVPLTQDESILAQFKAHSLQMSTPQNASWRVTLGNTIIPEIKYILQANSNAPVTTGTANVVGGKLYLKDLTHLNSSAQPAGDFISTSVTPGDVVVITAVTGAVTSNITSLPGSLVAGTFYTNTGTSTLTESGVNLLVGQTARALTTSTWAIASPKDLLGSWTVDIVENSNYMTMLGFEDLTNFGTLGTNTLGITYYVYRNLTRAQRAQAVADTSTSFQSNRFWHIQPDTVGVSIGGVTKYLPGYYLAAAHGGMVSGFPVQQSFTNISVAGIVDLQNSNFYFKKEELDLMAEAGTCLYVQETQGAVPYCRHSLTTDMSVLEYREQQKVKNWDFLSYFYYNKMKGFIGSWNITEDTMSNMKQTMIASSEYLLTQKLPRIGAPLQSYKEPTVAQNANNKDMTDVNIPLAMVTPNNYTNLYLIV